ncbi:MAG TPA: aldo/keto reductase [Pelolinea sp.]|nr:aldo/keto reductase [Pelolinea sp.]
MGNTGIEISSLCLGTMTFGSGADEKTSVAIFRRCREAGINFFDCADVYAGGGSEEILGELIQDCREEIVLITKFYGGAGDDINARGANRYHIRQAIEDSLHCLQTTAI